MSLAALDCPNPDFFVRSIPDNVSLGTLRTSLEGSEVFRDMFVCCDMGYQSHYDCDLIMTREDTQILDLNEPTGSLIVLLSFLRTPPPCILFDDAGHQQARDNPAKVMPLPLLFVLFGLADKYAFSQYLVNILHSHLLANAPSCPMAVYGFATQVGLNDIAAQASSYTIQLPLSAYSSRDVQYIPNVRAYHRLTLLHDLRARRLREVLLGEAIFPHGYGTCPAHKQQAVSIWDQRRNAVANRVGPATDIVAEMATLLGAFRPCHACHKACTIALEMLAYKCRHVPERVDEILDEI